MSKAPLSGKIIGEKYLAALKEYEYVIALRVLGQKWTEPEAEAFVAVLDAHALDMLGDSLDEAGPLVEAALRRRLAQSPDALARITVARFLSGGEVSPEELEALSAAQIVDLAARISTPGDGFRRLLRLLVTLAPERRALLVLSGPAAEVAALLEDPAAQAPLLEEFMRTGFAAAFNPGYPEERPNPVAYAISRFLSFPTPLRSRAAEVLRGIAASDAPETGFDGRTLSSWAAETIEMLVHRGELAG